MNENPYNPLQPTTDPTRFYGRQDALAFFQRHLAGAINQNALLVIGQRGTGKSSLLSQIPLHIDERYLCIWVDLGLLELDDPVAMVASIVDQTRAVMEAVEASTYRLPGFPDTADPNVDLLGWLASDFLDVALAAIRRQRHLVIMLDEAHLLFEAVAEHNFPDDFFDYLQSLLVIHEQLDLICTMDIRFEEQALSTPPFTDSTLHYRLLHLAADKATALIQQPVAGQYAYTPDALNRILALAGGHPFHIHSICRLLYRLWTERAPEVMALAEVETVYTAALEQAGDVVRDLWDYARPNERLALTALLDLYRHNAQATFPLEVVQDWLSNTDFPLNEVQLGAALRGLEYTGIIHTTQDGRYYFAAGIQADWLLQFSDIVPPEKADQSWWERLPGREVLAVVGATLVIGAVLLWGGLGGDDSPARQASPAVPTSTLSAPPTAIPSPTPTAPPSPTTLPTPEVFRFGG